MNVHGKTPCRDGQHTWTDHLRLEGFSPGENEYAFGIEDFFGDGIYSDGGYKVTGPDGAVIAAGGVFEDYEQTEFTLPLAIPPSLPPLPTEAAPGVDFDPPRGGGLPLCKCDAYHNKAFQLMSRMCQKEWMGQNICYPTTRVSIENNDWSQGTFLNGRLFDNRCDKYMTMCSPWSPPVRPSVTSAAETEF